MTEIRQLAELMRDYGLSRVEYDKDGTHVVLDRAPSAVTEVPSQAPVSADATTLSANESVVTAPIVGVVYSSREPDAAPFVTVGQAVKKGDIVCVIEAMKMFSDVEAPCDGVVTQVLFENGALAEFGQTLVMIAGV